MANLRYTDSYLLTLNHILLSNTSGSIINNYLRLNTADRSMTKQLVCILI
jgi:hypothetical protein